MPLTNAFENSVEQSLTRAMFPGVAKKRKRTARSILALYERIPQAHAIAHPEIVEFVRHRNLHGRGVGWTDAHPLASALVERFQLHQHERQLRYTARQAL